MRKSPKEVRINLCARWIKGFVYLQLTLVQNRFGDRGSWVHDSCRFGERHRRSVRSPFTNGRCSFGYEHIYSEGRGLAGLMNIIAGHIIYAGLDAITLSKASVVKDGVWVIHLL